MEQGPLIISRNNSWVSNGAITSLTVATFISLGVITLAANKGPGFITAALIVPTLR